MTREQDAAILECRRRFMQFVEGLRRFGVQVNVVNVEERHGALKDLVMFVACEIPPSEEGVVQ